MITNQFKKIEDCEIEQAKFNRVMFAAIVSAIGLILALWGMWV